MHLLTFPLRPLSQLSKRDNVWSQQSTYNITNKIIIKYIFETQLLSIFLKIICIIVLTLTNISDTHRGYFRVYVIRKTDIISIVCGTELIELSFHAKIIRKGNIEWYTPWCWSVQLLLFLHRHPTIESQYFSESQSQCSRHRRP